ncbi:hypothetical protein CEXT_181521 [Caerostris extrusa]|uniref:Uncharacterized protein n=1 Tax=Caerostris extrusa TaxID=172846 RepID=A0AAV4RK29_CAEEX|nr:hypothetical protein CEXT_181521 [Caerostris extrusa]
MRQSAAELMKRKICGPLCKLSRIMQMSRVPSLISSVTGTGPRVTLEPLFTARLRDRCGRWLARDGAGGRGRRRLIDAGPKMVSPHLNKGG